MKKTIALIMILVSSIFLVACKEDKHVSRELVIWAWNQNVIIMEDAIERYKEEVDPDFQARVEPFSQGDIDLKIKAAQQLNNPETLADVILGDSMRMRGYFVMWPELFYDFNDQNISQENLDRYVPSTVEVVTMDDTLFALPFGIAPTYVFAYRPLWEQNEIDDILENGWTWDDYKTYGLTISSRNTEDVYMTAYNLRGDDRLYRTMTSQKGEWFMSSELDVQVGNSNSIQAMTWVNDFYESGVIGHIDSGDYRSMMINGQIAAQIQGFFLGGQLKSVGQDTSGDWILLPLPSWEDNQSSASITGGSYLYVNDFSDENELAADFVSWYTLNTDAVVSALEIGGIYPALTDAYESDFFDQEDEFFGGQKYLKDVAENVSESPAIFASQFNAYNYNQFILGQEAILFNDQNISTKLNEVKSLIEANANS